MGLFSVTQHPAMSLSGSPETVKGAAKDMRSTNSMTFLSTTLFLLGLAGVAGNPVQADPPKKSSEVSIIRSKQSGPWSAPATWEGGKVPAAGARVLVQPGHRVVYDVKSEAPIRAINVAGTLRFATDRDTLLTVGLIKIQDSAEYTEEGFDCEAHLTQPDPKKERAALEVGTPNQPLAADRTSTIRLVYIEGMDKQSCPAIVCCGGRMDLHGAVLSRTWLKLGATAKKGDASVTLSEPVTGWRVGDRVIITATDDPDSRHNWGTEERTIRALADRTITFDSPLEHEHLGTGEYRGEIANLSRNIVVESADPKGVRGHTMYHRYSAGGISYTEFRHLGKEGVLGRYSLHYHLVGDTMRGSSVVGASIWGSQNRWLTIHGTNYLVVRDCVGYRSIGHGYFFEDGTEVYNVLDRNLAVQAERGKRLPKQVLPFDGNEGAGFWWANSLNTFTRNVSCENGRYGYRYEATPSSVLKLNFPVQQPDGTTKVLDIRTLPFVRFDDNESHSEGLYGMNIGEGVARVGPDTRHPFVMRNTKIWSTHYGFRPQVPSLLVEDLKIWKAAYGVYHPNYENHVYRDLFIGQTNTEPFNRGHDDLSAQYGVLTVDGLTFDGIRSGSQMPLIQISDDNMTGKAETHIRNLKVTNWSGDKRRATVNLGGGPRPTPKTEKGVPIYIHDQFGSGRHAKIVSTKTKELTSDGKDYREESLLTGDQSRVAEVSGIAFPTLLDPVDDLPPVTVITHVRRTEGNKVIVRGTTSDNGTIKRVVVNGKEARPIGANFAEWELVLEGVPSGAVECQAHAEDAAGNVEKRPHRVVIQ
jgi:hypothetical protein